MSALSGVSLWKFGLDASGSGGARGSQALRRPLEVAGGLAPAARVKPNAGSLQAPQPEGLIQRHAPRDDAELSDEEAEALLRLLVEKGDASDEAGQVAVGVRNANLTLTSPDALAAGRQGIEYFLEIYRELDDWNSLWQGEQANAQPGALVPLRSGEAIEPAARPELDDFRRVTRLGGLDPSKVASELCQHLDAGSVRGLLALAEAVRASGVVEGCGCVEIGAESHLSLFWDEKTRCAHLLYSSPLAAVDEDASPEARKERSDKLEVLGSSWLALAWTQDFAFDYLEREGWDQARYYLDEVAGPQARHLLGFARFARSRGLGRPRGDEGLEAALPLAAGGELASLNLEWRVYANAQGLAGTAADESGELFEAWFSYLSSLSREELEDLYSLPLASHLQVKETRRAFGPEWRQAVFELFLSRINFMRLQLGSPRLVFSALSGFRVEGTERKALLGQPIIS